MQQAADTPPHTPHLQDCEEVCKLLPHVHAGVGHRLVEGKRRQAKRDEAADHPHISRPHAPGLDGEGQL